MKNEQKLAAEKQKTSELNRYKDLLKNAGLDEKEILIFNYLLENGESGAGDIIRSVALKRGDAYNHIYSLSEKGLVSKRTVNGRMKFYLEPPTNLESYIENRAEAILEAQKWLKAVSPAILSTYNLSYHKPGVKVFEGEEAIKRVLEDTLRAKSEILAFIDLESIEKFIPEISRRYGKERDKLKKWKYNLVFDSKFNREFLKEHSRDYTEDRIINYSLNQAGVSLHIYDDTASFMTLKSEVKIGIIIDDPLIVNLLRGIFKALWQTAKPVNQLEN
jgi:sugar-specific transcriptional regulator TrmB